MLILASRSPRRRALLRAANLRFRTVAPAHEEAPPPRTRRYAALVTREALAKAQSVVGRARGTVLGADTVVVCDGRVLGKPRGAVEARRMLRLLSGRWHRVYTGLALVEGERRLLGWERTEVAFRRLSNGEIERYLATGEPMDKAGAYAIQGGAAAFVRAIRGCYTNVIGLPVPRLMEMLAEFGGAGARRGRR